MCLRCDRPANSAPSGSCSLPPRKGNSLVGVVIPAGSTWTPPRDHRPGPDCTRAEASGAGALWATDHLFWPRPMLECLTTLAVAAAATERVPTSASCVLQLPLRHPAAVAKQATALSSSRAAGSCWASGWAATRASTSRPAWTSLPAAHLLDQGMRGPPPGLGRPTTLDLGYRQLRPSAPVPVWIGGSSGAARRRAARVGDGWVPLFSTPRVRPRPSGACATRPRRRAGTRPQSPRRWWSSVGPGRVRPGAGRRHGLALLALQHPSQGLRPAPGGRAGRARAPSGWPATSTPGPSTSWSWWPTTGRSSSSPSWSAAFTGAFPGARLDGRPARPGGGTRYEQRSTWRSWARA